MMKGCLLLEQLRRMDALRCLILLLVAVQMVSSRGRPINIFSQKSGGDILQLRDTGKMFNALHRDSDLKWNIQDGDGNYVIPYRITGRYQSSELQTITRAMKRIEANTCIRFRTRKNERDYIEIQNQRGQGCYTSVGRPGGKSVLMLEAGYEETCMETEIVLHELLHVVGLWHEHMRYDRDKYIKVHYENIDRGYWSQFEKVSPYEATTFNVPYDYKSVMHYDKNSFAKPGKISMETLDRRYQDVIGNAKDASPNDYRKVCEIYGCSQCMSNSIPTESPVVTFKPTLPPRGRCIDVNPQFCRTIARLRVIDCMFHSKYCCATCASLGYNRRQTPWDSFYRLFDFWNRF
ncbi:unnamed protein product [Cylicocyclus nassatus]|uniref:Metalloendopeptidase n=1 Tax=Cylicocyclus nassatus TaxID=53992 RepID=A0AA36GQ24_CYLNA|nr:unnamed protein product [Cylicocyclus nassatus]